MKSVLIFATMRTRDENKIETLYAQALKMVVDEGFHGFSMQRLARAAGVSPATIYIYFKDKDDLLVQLYKKQSEEYFEYIMEGFDAEMDFATGLEVQWRNRADFLIKNPNIGHFLEMFTFHPLRHAFEKIRERSFPGAMKQFVKRAIANRELEPMPHEVFWSVAFAPLYNLVRYHKAGLNHAGEPFTLTDTMLKQTLVLVLKALKPDK